ncbi:MAG: Ig-like domain-containing protein [Thermoplasmatota archaeon]
MSNIRSGTRGRHPRSNSIMIIGMIVLLLGALFIYIPEEVSADSKPGGTLKNDQPASTTRSGWPWQEAPDSLQFKVPTKTNYYTSVAMVNYLTGEDFDLFVYSDYEMTQKIASSTKGSDKIDLVIIDGHTYTGSMQYAKVYKFTGSDWNSGVYIESDYHCVKDDLYGSDPDDDGPLIIGSRRYSIFEDQDTGYTGTLEEGEPLVNMYDVYLGANGEYEFDITSIPNTERLGMYLFKGSGNMDDALASDVNSATGGSLGFSYNPESSGWYGLCVVDFNRGQSTTDNYTVLISSDLEMTSSPASKLIAPGMNTSFSIDVSSLGVTKDIDLHYRWEDATGNISTPSGASASLSRSTVDPDGVGTERVYLNISTLNTTSAGTYKLVVYGNDTGYNGKTRWTEMTLRISTDPDFFLSSSPEHQIISPGTSATYQITMDTINSFSNNVSFTATPDKGASNFNFTFSPSTLNSDGSKTNLTVSTESDTPYELYNITVMGSDGTKSRYANVSIRIKAPVSIDVISPLENELISGVYTFKVKAGTPDDTDSVKVTFGGKMSNAGTLNMYYNSASMAWERDVNTFTFVDGFAWMNLTVKDPVGGITTYGPVNFTISNSAPNPIINTPMDRSYVTGSTMPISVNTTSYVISCRFKVDDNAWTPLSRNGNTWTGSWDSTQITDGEHTLTIEAKDTAGLTGESSVTIFVDNNRPTANINSPISGQYIEGSYTFRVVATDTVGIDHVDIHIFGQNTTLPYNPITSSYEYTVTTSTKPDGKYITYATAYDKVNLSKKSNVVSFNIDNNDPSLNIVDPIDEEIIGGDYTFSISSTDLFLNSVKYRVDQGGWMNFSGSEPNWNVVFDTTTLTDGDHTLTVRAVDNISHTTEQSLKFIVDNTNPTCSMVSPFGNQFLEGVHVFKVSASDSVGIDKVTLNIFEDSVQTSLNQQTGYYEYSINTLTVSDGTYQVVASAYDLSGKLTNATTTDFRVDNNAPVMSVNNVQAGDYVEGIFDFNVSVSDVFLKDTSYSVDGGGWVDIDTPWNTTALLDGSHTVMFRSRDQAGHATTQSIGVTVDNNVPIIAVNSPVANEYIQGAYRFRLSASDRVGIDRVEINVFSNNFTAIYSISSGYFEFNSDTSIQPDGNYSCYAVAYDLSGKKNTSSPLHFQVDNNAPVLRTIHPLDGTFLEGNETMIVNVTDIHLDRVEYDVDGSGWVPINTTLNTTIFGDGEHTINFRAFDKAGHVTVSSSDVYFDNTDPYGAISDPASGQFIEGTATFKVVASDIIGIDDVKIFIFGDELDMNYNSASGFYEYRTDTRLIPDGPYQMNVTVEDMSGKEVEIGPVLFNIDNHHPELVVKDLVSGDIIEGIYNFNVSTYDMFLDKVQYEVDATGWVDIDQPLNTSSFGDGSHLVKVRAVDRSEKTTTFEFDLLFDNEYPTCTINSPTEGEFVEGVITIRVTAFDLVQVDYVKIKVYNIEARVPYNTNTGYYEYTSNTVTWGSGEDGIRNVTATVYDLTGKTHSYGPVNFNVDNRPPTININSPLEGDVVSGLFFFDVDNGDVFKKGTEYNVDGASWQPVSIGWNTELVPDGEHVIRLRATDLAGHVTTETIRVYVDNHAPVVNIASPSENEFVEETFVFRVSATDEVGITDVIMNIAGEARIMTYNTQSGYYEYMIDTRTWNDGTFTMNASAQDVAGRRIKTGDLQFRVDNSPPELTVEAPVKGQLISGLFVVRARTSDEFPGSVRYSVDGTTLFEVTSPWNTTKISDGDHVITVITKDQAGHVTEFDVQVVVDNTDPVISQASITPGEIFAGVQTLRFYVYDSIGIRQVEVSMDDGPNIEIFKGESGLYYQYTMDTRNLADGDHTISVNAHDRAGNSKGSTYGIKVDNSGPEISLDYYWIEGDEEVRIGNVKEGNSVVFEATIKDPSGVSVVMINIDSTGWREMTPDSNSSNPDTYVLFWPTAEAEGGAHVFQIRTADKLGNEATTSGLINVKEKEEKTPFIESFTKALPMIWFILFIILIIVIFVLAYFGVLTKWARGEGRKKEPKHEGDEKGEDSQKEENKPKRSNPFKRKKEDEVPEMENWEGEEEK